MIKNNGLLEIDETLKLNKFNSIENKFDYILRENDLLYEKKISFNVAYNSVNKSYEINIIPENKDFDSQKYFMLHFETENGQKKLAIFGEENNIGLITY
jgi:hypothetical protein